MKRKYLFFFILTVYLFISYYGIIWMGHKLLPKYWDILITLPLSLYLMYLGAFYFLKWNDNRYTKYKILSSKLKNNND